MLTPAKLDFHQFKMNANFTYSADEVNDFFAMAFNDYKKLFKKAKELNVNTIAPEVSFFKTNWPEANNEQYNIIEVNNLYEMFSAFFTILYSDVSTAKRNLSSLKENDDVH